MLLQLSAASATASNRVTNLTSNRESRQQGSGPRSSSPGEAGAAGIRNGMSLWCLSGYITLVELTTPDSLKKVEHVLGISDMKIRVPSIFGRPTLDVPALYLILIGLLVYMGGPRAVLPIVALGYYLTTSTPARH